MDKKPFEQLSYRQQGRTCVLASYGVACFPFTNTEIDSYFLAYCNHYRLDTNNPTSSYENYFKKQTKQITGYEVLKELHEKSSEKVFTTARSLVSLTKITWPQKEEAKPEFVKKIVSEIKKADTLLLLFVNKSSITGLTMHSIVVSHDNSGIFYYDTNSGLETVSTNLSDFGELGDAFLITRKNATTTSTR